MISFFFTAASAALASYSFFDSPFLFVHDDLASGTGPLFHPAWYDDYIFPHYPEIFMEAKQMGKKVIFVADGNMSEFLPKLIEIGIDGFMFENPATPIEKVIEHFGQPGKFMIGGINTVKLTTGSPNDIRKMVLDLMKKTDGIHTAISIFQMFFVLLFLYSIGSGIRIGSGVDSRAFESMMVMMVGIMSLLGWYYAMHRGNLLDTELSAEDAVLLRQKNMAEPITAAITIPFAFVGPVAWELSWFLYPFIKYPYSRVR